MTVSSHPLVIPHRGVTQLAPENTMEAIRATLELGLAAVEVDVQSSRDGEIVVVHDSNLTRLTLGHPAATNGIIANMSWKELAEVELPYANHLLSDFPEGGFSNEFLALSPYRLLGQAPAHLYENELKAEPRVARLIRFEELARWLRDEAPANYLAEIEFKAPGMTERCDEIVRRYGVGGKCVFFSGARAYIDELQAFYRAHPKPEGLRLGANIRALSPEAADYIGGMDLYEVGLDAWNFGLDEIDRLRARGTLVFSNLGDTPGWWSALKTMPVAGFKTNFAEKALAAVR